MVRSYSGAITSPQLLKRLYTATNKVNPACGMLFLYILETGSRETDALKLTVSDMEDYIYSDDCELSNSTKTVFIDFCSDMDKNCKFFSYQNEPLTKSKVSIVWEKVLKLCPPYMICSMSLRKTYYWRLYLKASDKRDMMRKFQKASLESLAEYFDVPIEALTHKDKPSTKTALLNTSFALDVIKQTKELLDKVYSDCQNTLLSDEYFANIHQYLCAIDSSNDILLNKLKSDGQE